MKDSHPRVMEMAKYTIPNTGQMRQPAVYYSHILIAWRSRMLYNRDMWDVPGSRVSAQKL